MRYHYAIQLSHTPTFWRIVIFSGGAKKNRDQDIFDEVTAIRDGGGFGSIIGRNTFQRKKTDALKFLDQVLSIYAKD